MKMVPCECGCGKSFTYGTGKRRFYSDDCRNKAGKLRRAAKRAGMVCVAEGCGKPLNQSRIAGYNDTCSDACKRKVKGISEEEKPPKPQKQKDDIGQWYPDQGKGNASNKIRQEYCLQKYGGYAAPCQTYSKTIGQGCYDGRCYRP